MASPNPRSDEAEDRPSSHAQFWDTRYTEEGHLFGTGPSAFVAAEAGRIPLGSRVVELGAGEARNLVYLAARYEHRVTAVDFSKTALREAETLAEARGVDLRTVAADVRSWTPSEQWDAVLVTFVQLLPDERPGFCRLIRRILRPDGILIGEWFRPDHFLGPYARIGPPRADRMVSPRELRQHFAADDILLCEPVDITLDEGEFLKGPAAVARLLVRRGAGEDAG